MVLHQRTVKRLFYSSLYFVLPMFKVVLILMNQMKIGILPILRSLTCENLKTLLNLKTLVTLVINNTEVTEDWFLGL